MVCAASAFSMTVTGLEDFLRDIDVDFFRYYRGNAKADLLSVKYVEPRAEENQDDIPGALDSSKVYEDANDENEPQVSGTISSKIVTLGDFIDTDALAPGPTLTSCRTDEEFGQHVLEHTHPDFRSKVAGGQQIVVGGQAFGVGSSRECAVSALKGAGVKAVIAKSFAFIYSRNQPSLGLLGIVMEDEDFFAVAKEGEDIEIDVAARTIKVAGKQFGFKISNMEYQLTINNGIAKTYGRFGKHIWERLMKDDQAKGAIKTEAEWAAPGDSRLNW